MGRQSTNAGPVQVDMHGFSLCITSRSDECGLCGVSLCTCNDEKSLRLSDWELPPTPYLNFCFNTLHPLILVMGRDLLNIFMVTASYLGFKIVFKFLGLETVSNLFRTSGCYDT